MLRFGANIGMLFAEYPFVERFDRAAAAGFGAIEFPQPYEEDVRVIQTALTRNGLQLVQFNLPWGDPTARERGMANDPRRKPEFRAGVARALEIANRVRCPRILCHAGLPDVPIDTQRATVVENLAYAAEQAAASGIHILVEPLNALDLPGYILTTMAQAVGLLDEVEHDNVRILCDVYHMARMQGNLTETILTNLGRIEHFEIAGAPSAGDWRDPLSFSFKCHRPGRLQRLGLPGVSTAREHRGFARLAARMGVGVLELKWGYT